MSDFTNDALGRYLDQQPGMRKALLTDPLQKAQVEALRQTLNMVERSLADEGVPDDVRRRVINRVIWGDPEGLVDAHARMHDPEKLRRERELLLTTFDPSEFGRPPNAVFTEPSEDFGVQDELKPYTGPVSSEEKNA